MALRDDIVFRGGILYFALAIVALAILIRIVILQTVEYGKWSAMSEKYVFKRTELVADRGDILACDGRQLATSVPYYTIYMDTRSSGMPEETWAAGINGLSAGLARHLGTRTAPEWKAALNNARRRGDRYFLIKRKVDYKTLKNLRELPVFREGRYRGGLIAEAENRRILPNNELAARTIGYLSQGEKGNTVGIEGSFDRELSGRNGAAVMQRLAGGDWITVDGTGTVSSRDGNDVVTTIDIDLQDVAATALANQLRKHNAHHGCAVVMKVNTGDIRAMVNLEAGSDGRYHESYNYAVGESTEPGSTFKLPVLMAALEEGIIDTGDIVDTGRGSIRFYDKVIRDTKEGGYGMISVREVFEKSSNVGTARLITDLYGDRPGDFVDRLYAMKLNQKLGIRIQGEGTPLIRYPGDKLWSGISLAMMSYGYEVRMTPLQILTFYNAVANNGKMVRPRFVTAIERNGREIKHYNPEVIIKSVASRSTIKKVRKMMEGVVEHGTATNLKNTDYKIAGKTGTAQIAKGSGGYRSDSGISYQASFVGYFPAEDPLYSCIVVVNAPSNGVYYGNQVAGTVFREIADRIYATSFYRDYRSSDGNRTAALVPQAGNGYRDDIHSVLGRFGGRPEKTTGHEWIKTRQNGDTVSCTGIEITGGMVPDVRGMSLRDAMHLLENSGYRVRFSGRGRVLRQFPEHGTRYFEGQVVSLEMNL
ncbi:MAG TPA: penicillin-binding protein [Bacteroidales bacterium]|jgi:cell division protein FtsI (penicillin-binding protein 3)|nr:penicillin-binding protein [Bacteroidales bacterium]HOS72648.1 penicillin-binding protein [Bacteroidales bacterium]HQH24067.1 penicillin-binding protein [Bacteroidales bacterium]HQJ83021.1 penicillin-binding protein [Bacteroidales bacterium]